MFLDTAMKCWQRLNMSITPKLHLLEDHLLDVLEHIKMLEYFDEEFVERAHQKGLKYNRITKGMSRNPLKKYSYMVRWELARSQSALEQSQNQTTHHEKWGGKQMKLDRQEKRIVSREMALEELNYLKPHFFQTADQMNVIIAKRITEQQHELALMGIL